MEVKVNPSQNEANMLENMRGERKRNIEFSDLHPTLQQELINIRREFEILKNKYRNLPETPVNPCS